jgi:TatD DNase family protein
MLIDTHTHLYLEQFDEDRPEMIQRAIEKGITHFYMPSIDSNHIESMFQLEAQFPSNCFAMMGLHPCSVKENVEEELAIVEKYLSERKFIAVGEIGLDYYWDTTFVPQQKVAFVQQMEWAKHYKIPISIHCRESMDDAIELVSKTKTSDLNGVFHCFGGTIEQANKIIELGFYLGIGGVLTYKKSGLDEVLKNIDLQHIVLETDAPYLSPVPYRGKRNESAYIYEIAKKLAEVKDVDISEVAARTTENAKKVFNQFN